LTSVALSAFVLLVSVNVFYLSPLQPPRLKTTTTIITIIAIRGFLHLLLFSLALFLHTLLLENPTPETR
jgi:hypothetical protein